MAIGVAVFEAIDALPGGGSSLNGRTPGLISSVQLWLPVASPGLAGLAAAWLAPPTARAGLLAAVAAVWLRIGTDRLIGVMQGAQLPAETGVILILAFGVPWTLTALAGGVVLIGGRALLRGRYGSSPRVM